MEKGFPTLMRLATKKDKSPWNKKKFSGAFRAEDLRFIIEEQKNIYEKRGAVISASLSIETRLNDILSGYFFPKNKPKRSIFMEFCLEKEHFTFMQKWKLLRTLLRDGHLRLRTEKDLKNLLKNLHKIIEVRNNFAHGEIIFFGKPAFMRYVKNGDIVHVGLNKTYFNKLKRLFNQTVVLLGKLCSDSKLPSRVC